MVLLSAHRISPRTSVRGPILRGGPRAGNRAVSDRSLSLTALTIDELSWDDARLTMSIRFWPNT